MTTTSKREAPDPIDRHVGQRVRARRLGLRLSQTRLGAMIGVTFQQIQKYENGTNRIGASNLYRIANALGVDVNFFYEGLGERTEPVASGDSNGQEPQLTADPLNSREAIELMHNYFRIDSAEVRRRLFQFVKTLSGSDRTA